MEGAVWAGNRAKCAGCSILVSFVSQKKKENIVSAALWMHILHFVSCLWCCSLGVTLPPAVQIVSLLGKKCSLTARHDDSMGKTGPPLTTTPGATQKGSLLAQLWWNIRRQVYFFCRFLILAWDVFLRHRQSQGQVRILNAQFVVIRQWNEPSANIIPFYVEINKTLTNQVTLCIQFDLSMFKSANAVLLLDTAAWVIISAGFFNIQMVVSKASLLTCWNKQKNKC